MPYEELAKKYNCNANTIKRKLKEYCKGHNLELHERILRIEKINIILCKCKNLSKYENIYRGIQKNNCRIV